MTYEVKAEDSNGIWKAFIRAPKDTPLKPTLNSILYHKYASSQNYYYTKDLNDILTETRAAPTFVVKDWSQYDTV
jgi:hypothetical protein